MGIVHRRAFRTVLPSAATPSDRLGGARVRRRPADADAYAGGCADAGGEPLLYPVQEAAQQLRIGRTLAYQLVEQYIATDGREGIPAIKIGNCLRVPRPGLVVLALTGRLASSSELESYIHGLLRRHNAPQRIVVRRGGRVTSRAAADRSRPSSTDRSPIRARRSPTGRRAGSAEPHRLLPAE